MNPERFRGIEADFGPPAVAGPDTFRRDLHPDLRADYVLANPPLLMTNVEVGMWN